MAGDDPRMDELRDQISGLKVDIARVEAETRVTKHDVNNLHTMFTALGIKFEKLEDKLATKMDALSLQLTNMNLKHERGLGFFAGVTSVITIAGGLLLAIVKLLFTR